MGQPTVSKDRQTIQLSEPNARCLILLSSNSARITSLQLLSHNRKTLPAVAQEPWIRNTIGA